MADLNLLYSEDGLDAIIPYAFGMNGRGYTYLCNKLKEGESFWIPFSDTTNLPIVQASNEKIFFSIFTSHDFCNQFCNKLALDNICAESVQEAPGEHAHSLYKRFRDLGATHLLINESIWASISDIVPLATYDGLLNLNAPLRNAELNAVLYFTLQISYAGYQQNDLIALLWDTLNKSTFLAPIRPKTFLQPGESLDDNNMELHIEINTNGNPCLIIFTDPDFLLSYALNCGLRYEQYSAAYTPSFSTLLNYLHEQPELSIMINPGYGDILLTHELLSQMQTIALNIRASSHQSACSCE